MSEVEPTPPPSSPAREPKVIKRYSNRKLYDTEESRYVTLEEIGEMIKLGVEVKIIDNRNKEDLTSVTLAQIILEEEKKTNRMPLSVLREIIRHPGESISDFFQKEVGPRVASLREEAELKLDKLLRREEDKSSSEPDVTRSSQKLFEEWQRRLDDRIRSIVESIVGNLPALGRDIQSLVQRIDELERKLDAAEKKNQAPPEN